MEVGSGTLATDSSLVVNKILSFVGGSITSSTTPGIIHVTGTASGGAQAIVRSSVNLGSFLNIEGNGVQGAKLTLTGGTISTNNNSQINVMNHSESKNSSSVTFNGGFLVVNSTHDVQVNSPLTAKLIEVQGLDGVFKAHSAVTTTGGDFTLYNGQVFVDGGVQFNININPNIAALLVDGGTFRILANTTSSIFTVNGRFTQTGGELSLGDNQSFATMRITGKTDLTAGKITLADVGTPESDMIECYDQITFGAAYAYAVATGGVSTGAMFLPFRATLGFVGTPIVVGYTVSSAPCLGRWVMYITKN